MIERARGIVLRTRPLTETSLIVEWLTVEHGRISTVARGARRPKSPYRGKLDLFYEAEFSFNRSRRSELHTLSEVKLLATRESLRHDIGYLQQAAYCSAMVNLTTERETPLPAVFELVRGFLDALPLTPPQAQTVFAFELKLLVELGLGPDMSTVSVTPGSRQVMEKLLALEWPAITRLRLSEAQTSELERFLHGFVIYHCERLPAGRQAALHPTTS